MLNHALALLLLSFGSAAKPPADLLVLVHTSTGAGADRDVFAKAAASVIDEFDDLRVAVSAFVDKPIVHAGYGAFGGWGFVAEEDFCYWKALDFTEANKEKVTDAILNLPRGGGLDLADGQLEALVTAALDNTLGWRANAQKYILLLTNSVAHAGDHLPAKEFVNAFNADVECVDGTTVGGFGAEKPSVDVLEAWTPFKEYYAEYASLIKKEVCHGEQLSAAEGQRRDLLEEQVFNGSFVPSIQPFDASVLKVNPSAHCEGHEYPTYAQVSELVKDFEVYVAIPKAHNEVIDHWTTATCEQGLKVLAIEEDGHLELNSEAACAHNICGYKAVELMVLMDASVSWTYRAGDVPRKLAEGLAALSKNYPILRMSFANFVDKPNVQSGVGTFGGYPNGGAEDWCYSLLNGMTDKSELDIEQIILEQPTGVGLDVEEAHLEALMHSVLDANVNWSDDEDVERVVLLVTDDVGHEGEAYKPLMPTIDKYNTPVTCNEFKNETLGGFGASQYPAIDIRAWTPFTDEYAEYVAILKEHLCEDNTTRADRKAELEAKFVPMTVPSLKPFDLDVLKSDKAEHCRNHEYPTYSVVGQTLRGRNASLAVLLLDFSESRRRLEVGFESPMQHPRHFVAFEDLPEGMKKALQRQTFSARTAASTVEDIWRWILTDELAWGNLTTSLISVTPTEVDSFVDQLQTIIGEIVQPCPTAEPDFPYCEEEPTECEEGIWNSLNAQPPY